MSMQNSLTLFSIEPTGESRSTLSSLDVLRLLDTIIHDRVKIFFYQLINKRRQWRYKMRQTILLTLSCVVLVATTGQLQADSLYEMWPFPEDYQGSYAIAESSAEYWAKGWRPEDTEDAVRRHIWGGEYPWSEIQRTEAGVVKTFGTFGPSSDSDTEKFGVSATAQARGTVEMRYTGPYEAISGRGDFKGGVDYSASAWLKSEGHKFKFSVLGGASASFGSNVGTDGIVFDDGHIDKHTVGTVVRSGGYMAGASLLFQDYLVLEALAEGEVIEIAGSDVYLRYRIQGKHSQGNGYNPGYDPDHTPWVPYDFMEVGFKFGTNLWESKTYKRDFLPGIDLYEATIDTHLDGKFRLEQHGDSYRTKVDGTIWGVISATFDFSQINYEHTVELESILIGDDRQTPESLGYQAFFASGAAMPSASPNGDVPEPSTIVLFGSFCMAFVGVRRRR
jgi:PEP-CTERM motif-containing protein